VSNKVRVVVISSVIVLTGVAGWYWWNHRRIEMYGGVKPFMKRMKALHFATAQEINRPGKLTPEYADMERLTQAAQDVFPVFAKDQRGKDPRFGGLATELMRHARAMEYAWEAADKEKVNRSFQQLTNACNACHNQLGQGKPPKISADRE